MAMTEQEEYYYRIGRALITDRGYERTEHLEWLAARAYQATLQRQNATKGGFAELLYESEATRGARDLETLLGAINHETENQDDPDGHIRAETDQGDSRSVREGGVHQPDGDGLEEETGGRSIHHLVRRVARDTLAGFAAAREG